MKSLSASIVVTAGLATVVSGASMRSDAAMVVVGVGVIVAFLGMVYWIKSLNQP